MSKTILIIEDEEFLLDAYKLKFSQEQFNIEVAMNGEDGLEKAKEKKPDLIVLDLVLPGKDGLAVLKALKETEKTKHIPVIVATNSDDDLSVKTAKSQGAQDYFVKSGISINKLVEKCAKILS